MVAPLKPERGPQPTITAKISDSQSITLDGAIAVMFTLPDAAGKNLIEMDHVADVSWLMVDVVTALRNEAQEGRQ